MHRRLQRAKLPRRCAGGPSLRRPLNHFIRQVDDKTPRFRLAVKDNIATSSVPTTCASAMLSGYHSPIEATVVTQLRALGAVLVGKTNLDEFGMGSHSVHSAAGPVTSPVVFANDRPRSAGGSSGGSAAAVAAGEADVALGTDTGGSVRLPAAWVGVVGYKPSYGMVSRYGVVPYANSMDTVGFLAPRVADMARLVVGRGRLFAEHDPRDPTSLSEAARRRCTKEREGYGEDGSATLTSLDGLRFGIPLEYNIEELHPRIRHAWSTAAAVLQNLGADVVPVRLPSTRHALSAYYVIAPAEASSNLAKYDGVRYGIRDASRPDADDQDVLYAATRGAGFGDEVKRRILLGSYTLSSEAMDNYFVQAQRVRALVRRDFDAVFRLANPLLPEALRQFDLTDMSDAVELQDKFGPPEVDFLLCPTAPTFPPALEEVLGQTPLDAYVNDVFTAPASLAGLPAVSVPMPIHADTGHIAGLQLIAQFWDDARLLSVAELMADALTSTTESRP